MVRLVLLLNIGLKDPFPWERREVDVPSDASVGDLRGAVLREWRRQSPERHGRDAPDRVVVAARHWDGVDDGAWLVDPETHSDDDASPFAREGQELFVVRAVSPRVEYTVKTLDGACWPLQVGGYVPVVAIKRLLGGQCERLIFAGKVLDDERTTADYGMQRGSTVHAIS